MHGVVFVESFKIRVHGLDVLPGRGHQHTQGARHIHATGQQYVQHVVQAGGVRAGAVYQRGNVLDIGQKVGLKARRASFSPIAVAIDGIDLTVVSHQSERLCQGPTRHGIGRKALMEHADRGFQPLVAQVLVEMRQIHWHHQAFVSNHTARQATDVIVFVALIGHFCLAPGHKQFGAQFLLGDAGRINKYLLNDRQARQCDLTADIFIRRHHAPAQYFKALIDERLFGSTAGGSSLHRVSAQEYLADAIIVAEVRIETFPGQRAHKLVGHLQQQTTAIASLAVCGNTATVGHAGQGLDGRLQQAMTRVT